MECGLQQVEMARDITELQYEVAVSGYRRSHDSSNLIKYLLSRPSYTKERKDMIMEVREQVKRDSRLWVLSPSGYCLHSP